MSAALNMYGVTAGAEGAATTGATGLAGCTGWITGASAGAAGTVSAVCANAAPVKPSEIPIANAMRIAGSFDSKPNFFYPHRGCPALAYAEAALPTNRALETS
jgi:hypothetical protein